MTPSRAAALDPNTGTGNGGDPGIVDPGEPEPTIVKPGAGLAGVHPVGAAKLDTAVNGRDLAVRVSWWSGASNRATCSPASTSRATARPSPSPSARAAPPRPTSACIEIAQYKATIVDLGELEPGTYTVTAFGEATPLTVTID